MDTQAQYDNVMLELRRGVIVLAVLSQLEHEQYGYSLMKSLIEQGLNVDQGTLYPLLRRLESQGLLKSQWKVEADRPRRYYSISDQGQSLLPRLKLEWENLVKTLAGLIR